ncbi:MAG: rhodanese-like domain-containing protein [Clostridium sp.]
MFNFLTANRGKSVNVNDIDELIGNIELIDIREPFEVTAGTIKTSKNIPIMRLLDNPENFLNKNKEYHIMCQSGGRSARACSALRASGFDVVDVIGGYGSYVGSQRK